MMYTIILQMSKLIVRLLKKSELTYRKITQITEKNLNTVYLVSKNTKE